MSDLSRRKFLGAVSATAVAAVVPVEAVAAAAQEAIDAKAMADFPAFLAQKHASWLPCDGRELPISEFKKLYDVIGASYGGDVNRQTFKLPDLRATSPIPDDSDCPRVCPSSGEAVEVATYYIAFSDNGQVPIGYTCGLRTASKIALGNDHGYPRPPREA